MGKFSRPYSRDNNLSSKSHPKNVILNDKKFTKLKELMQEFEDKYRISKEEMLDLVKEPSIELPLSIYSKQELSSLESTVKYLKENLGLKFSKIAEILNRDERTIWSTYNNARKKYSKLLDTSSKDFLPIQVISQREYSILESITGYLKEKKEFKYSQIARILARDQRTIWTCYNRLQKKRGEKK